MDGRSLVGEFRHSQIIDTFLVKHVTRKPKNGIEKPKINIEKPKNGIEKPKNVFEKPKMNF